MLAFVLVVCGLLGTAAVSAMVAYRRPGSDAWSAEYDNEGLGLTIELALLAVVVLVGVAISIIMRDSFRTLFLEGAWRSYSYLGVAVGVASGVAVYMLVAAPRILARKQAVESHHKHRQCVLPYLAYTPFSIILWVGFVLPVIALLALSFHSDHRAMLAARHDLADNGALAITLTRDEPEAAREHVALYGVEYRESVRTVQETISRYLWVVGVFIFFLIVILNTRITAAYTEEAQDAFKWMMWLLLAVAVAISLYGLARFQDMRELAIGAYGRMADGASSEGQLRVVVAAREAMLELRQDGPVEFLRGAVAGGLALVVVSQGLQIVMAKVTHRSAVGVIFPRRVARFLNGFLLEGEQPPASR